MTKPLFQEEKPPRFSEVRNLISFESKISMCLNFVIAKFMNLNFVVGPFTRQ